MADLRQDLTFAARTLRSAPAFAATVILTLAIGIGATTAIYSIVDGVVLKPLPFPQSDRIVRLYQVTAKGTRNSVSQPNFYDWQSRTRSFSSMALMSGWTGTNTVQTPGGPIMTRITPVTRDFFKVLQVQPILGRLFVPEEQVLGGAGAAVISDAFWRSQMGGRRDVLGQRIVSGNDSYQIVGVIPSRDAYPQDNQIWVPIELGPRNTGRTSQGHAVIARLAPGVSIDAAQRELRSVSRAMKIEYGNETSMSDAMLIGLRDQMVGDARPRLFVLLGASAFLLLIGLANALNLMTARLAVRENELAVRVALGATASRLVRQVLVEAAVLVFVASMLGLVIVVVVVRGVAAAPSSVLPRADEISVSWPVLAFAVCVAVALTLALGVIAALRSARQDVRDALSANPRAMSAAGGVGLRRTMVVGQLALTVVLLTGAALLGRSFLRLLQVNPGFATEHVAVIEASPTIADRQQRLAYYNTLIDRVRSVSGVIAAGAGTGVPIANSPPDGGYILLDTPVDSIGFDAWLNLPPSRKGHGNYVVVDGDYFAALSIPLLKGRLFNSADRADSRPVAVVSTRFAEQSWPGENPMGKNVDFGNMDGDMRSLTVVGVVGDVHDDGLAAAPPPTLYSYYPQRLRTYWPMTLAVRTSGDPAPVIGAVQRIVHDLRPDVAVRAQTIDRVLSSSVADRRFTLFIIVAFAGSALLLATLGVYGIVSYVVTQRTREIGVRVALGAQRQDVLRLILGEGMRLTVTGTAIGIAASLLLTRLLRGLVFGVSTTDPTAFTLVAVLLVAVALVATFVPGRRATRVDPMQVLRST